MRIPCSLSLIASLAALGCVPDFQENVSLVAAPRIIAVRAEPAEVEPRGTVKLTGLVAGPGTLPDEVAYTFCTRAKPLTVLGPIDPACLANEGDAVLPLGSGVEVTGTILDDACELFGPAQRVGDDGQSVGRPADPDPTGGYYQPLLATLPEREAVLGGVRLRCGLPRPSQTTLAEYNRRFRPNQNPELASVSIRRGGGWEELTPDSSVGEPPAVSVRRGDVVRLRAEWPSCPESAECGDGICAETETLQSCADDCRASAGCTGAESYIWYDLETRTLVDRREEMIVAWYATGGTFDSTLTEPAREGATTSDNVWTVPSSRGEARLWAVVRDGRAGVGFRSYRLQVE